MEDRVPDPMIVLLTRPEASALRFAERIHARMTAEVVIAPMVRIDPVPAEVKWDRWRGAILTSQHGAGRLGDVPDGLPAFCVGRRTAQVAEAAGCTVRSADGDAEALIAMIAELRPEGPLLHLRGEVSRGEIAGRLTALGLETGETVVYRQQDLPLSDAGRSVLSGSRAVTVPLFSPRAAERLVRAGPFGAPVMIAAMSAEVARAAEPIGAARIVVAERPNAASLLKALSELRGA
ncbi:uroporphyrinogen-III synthase [Aestuariibius insulae]|uniref:uroporphyrinogen-III synthase n=1 Tax=Aestuariibius insulae TaxID=2058287 RepID=UPI00398EF3CA